jgi:AcrR family transcriptional regulator
MPRAAARTDSHVAPDDDKRERILVAALQAFSQRGFDGTTTREIAAAAGVNLGLIQYYFEGKENLWRAAVGRAFERIQETFAGVLEGAGDDDARTRLLVRTWIRFIAAHPEFVRLMHDEGKRDGPRMRWLVDEHVRALYEAIGAILTRAQERGRLPAHIDVVHFHYLLIGAAALIFHQAEECKRLTGVDPADADVIERHADAVEWMLLGARPEEKPE